MAAAFRPLGMSTRIQPASDRSMNNHIELVLRRQEDLHDNRPDYSVYAGAQLVGRIYPTHFTGVWFWGVNGLTVDSTVEANMQGHATVQKHGPLILTNSRHRPWTSLGFQSVWTAEVKKAGIAGLTFHDLRGTAVTRLALVGCTVAEIATITGHSLRDVHTILDSNYLHRDVALGDSAIRKLEGAKR